MRLNYRQYSDKGRPVLILHGLFGSLSNWGWHSKQLADDFAVFGVDLRNHGDSPHCDEMDYPAMAADVKALMQELGLQHCALIGHSMGGKVAMQLALSEPEMVDRLIVVDIAPVQYRAGSGPDSHQAIIAAMQAMSLDSLTSRGEAERLLLPVIADTAIRRFVLTNLQRCKEGGYQWRLNLSAISANYDRLREKPAATGSFDKPTLFVKGAESNYIQASHEDEIRELFPRARVKIIMQAGHWLHADKPQAFQKIAMDFLQEE